MFFHQRIQPSYILHAWETWLSICSLFYFIPPLSFSIFIRKRQQTQRKKKPPRPGKNGITIRKWDKHSIAMWEKKWKKLELRYFVAPLYVVRYWKLFYVYRTRMYLAKWLLCLRFRNSSNCLFYSCSLHDSQNSTTLYKHFAPSTFVCTNIFC